MVGDKIEGGTVNSATSIITSFNYVDYVTEELTLFNRSIDPVCSRNNSKDQTSLKKGRITVLHYSSAPALMASFSTPLSRSQRSWFYLASRAPWNLFELGFGMCHHEGRKAGDAVITDP